MTHLLPEGDPPSPSVQRLADPPLRGIRSRLQERLQEAGLPAPVTEHDYNLPPPTRSRLVFLVGLAVGAGAALDLLWLDGRKAAERIGASLLLRSCGSAREWVIRCMAANPVAPPASSPGRTGAAGVLRTDDSASHELDAEGAKGVAWEYGRVPPGRVRVAMAATGQKPVPLRVDSKGRVMLPASFRKALGLEAGDTLFAQQVGRTLRLVKAEDPIFLLWQQAEKEYAEGRTVSLEEFAAREGIDLSAPEDN